MGYRRTPSGAGAWEGRDCYRLFVWEEQKCSGMKHNSSQYSWLMLTTKMEVGEKVQRQQHTGGKCLKMRMYIHKDLRISCGINWQHRSPFRPVSQPARPLPQPWTRVETERESARDLIPRLEEIENAIPSLGHHEGHANELPHFSGLGMYSSHIGLRTI